MASQIYSVKPQGSETFLDLGEAPIFFCTLPGHNNLGALQAADSTVAGILTTPTRPVMAENVHPFKKMCQKIL